MSRRISGRSILLVAITIIFLSLRSIVQFNTRTLDYSTRRDSVVYENVAASTIAVDRRINHTEEFSTVDDSIDISVNVTDPPASVARSERGVIIEPSQNATLSSPFSEIPIGSPVISITKEESSKAQPPGHHNHTASPRYAYAFALWRLDPDKPNYQGYLANVLIATRLLRLHGSKADFVMILKLHYDSSHDTLPPDELQLLEKMKIRIHYLPKEEDDRHLNIYGTMFHKFTVFRLTEYRQVMYLDSDFMPLNNLDYLMEQADYGFLKPTVVIASNREPSNGGMMVVRPNDTVYQDIQRIIQEWGRRLGNIKEWNDTLGWGHVIQPTEDAWETNTADNRGTRWNFWAANADQGFIYHYCKYVLKDCTQILARKVVNFGPTSPSKNTTFNNSNDKQATTSRTIEEQWNITSIKKNVWTDVAPKKAYGFTPSNCGRLTSSSSPDWPGCGQPYWDFRHFTGRSKPWKDGKNKKMAWQPKATSTDHLWWNTFLELQTVEGLNNISSVLGIPFPF